MQLIYKIEFNTTNLYFKHIIECLINEAKINAICKQYNGFILIILDTSGEEIEDFFALLEKKLPLSIFIGKSYVVESYDETLEEIESLGIKATKVRNILIPDIVKSMIGSYNGEHLTRIPNEEDFTHAINL